MIVSGSLELADKFVQQTENGVRIPSTILSPMGLNELSIRELLEYCLRTNLDAGWKAFFCRTRKTIEGALARRLRSWCTSYHDRIEDLRQETYAKLLNNEKRLLLNLKCESDGQLCNYIAMTAGSVAEDYRRKEQKMRQNTDSIDDAAYPQLPAEELLHRHAEFQEAWDSVERCLDKMECGPRDRAIFYFFYKQGYSAREVGELPSIQLPIRTVENILLRLVRRVRSELDRGKSRGKGSGA